MSTLPLVAAAAVVFLMVPPAPPPSTGVGAGVAVAGVAQPGPKKPAAAGVPGESGAVAVATIGHALASDADTVRETRRPSLPAAGLAAMSVVVSTAVGFLGVVAVFLGVQQFLTHLSQTRFGAV